MIMNCVPIRNSGDRDGQPIQTSVMCPVSCAHARRPVANDDDNMGRRHYLNDKWTKKNLVNENNNIIITIVS